MLLGKVKLSLDFLEADLRSVFHLAPNGYGQDLGMVS